MTVQSIGTTVGGASAALQGAGLTQQDFLKVLLTQLSYQDPLKPMDNQQFLAQMAQFSTLSLMQDQNNKVDSLLTIQSASQTVGLLGKSVQVSTSTGARIGSVSGIAFGNDGTPTLNLTLSDGTVLTGIGLAQISLVSQPSPPPQQP